MTLHQLQFGVQYSRTMAERPFEVVVDGCRLRGAAGGSGPAALLLHGGPGVPDYTGPLAAELAPLVATLRFTQRGVAPSDAQPPYSVEVHARDAVAVLDAHGVDRAWAIGHSWGGQLALHLAVEYSERLLGIVCIDPLGASGDALEEFRQNFATRMPAEAWTRAEALDLRSDDNDLSIAGRERAALESHHLIWPYYFAYPATAGPDYLIHYCVECAAATFASVQEHFERQTLIDGLPSVRLPALFVHGEDDPLPVRCSTETAGLIQDATVELIPECGHFPWLERPGAVADAVRRLLTRTQD
jgi:pimeloyl-ACP methyl ester carboxylesterase